VVSTAVAADADDIYALKDTTMVSPWSGSEIGGGTWSASTMLVSMTLYHRLQSDADLWAN
jgi:hypothetical protein